MAAEPRQGEIWLARFDPVEGHEQGGQRPALVLSNDRYNRLPSGLCIVAPMTTRDRGISFHIRVEPPEGGLSRTSYILPEQIRALSVSRLLKRWGMVRPETSQRVGETLVRFIDSDRLF